MANREGIIPVFTRLIPDIWDRNDYTLAVIERLGLENNVGMVRVGPVHYNTREEIERFGEALRKTAITELPGIH
jgi:hypothetical protein